MKNLLNKKGSMTANGAYLTVGIAVAIILIFAILRSNGVTSNDVAIINGTLELTVVSSHIMAGQEVVVYDGDREIDRFALGAKDIIVKKYSMTAGQHVITVKGMMSGITVEESKGNVNMSNAGYRTMSVTL